MKRSVTRRRGARTLPPPERGEHVAAAVEHVRVRKLPRLARHQQRRVIISQRRLPLREPLVRERAPGEQARGVDARVRRRALQRGPVVGERAPERLNVQDMSGVFLGLSGSFKGFHLEPRNF